MAALLVANTLLWPMARFLNDKFVPEEHRVTANHIMTVGHSPLHLSSAVCRYLTLSCWQQARIPDHEVLVES